MKYIVGVPKPQDKSRRRKELINFRVRKEAPPPHPAGRGPTAKQERKPRSWEQLLKVSVWYTKVATPLEKGAGSSERCPDANTVVNSMVS